MAFSRQEYWSTLPFPTPGDLPHPGMKPETCRLLHYQVDSLPRDTWQAPKLYWACPQLVAQQPHWALATLCLAAS